MELKKERSNNAKKRTSSFFVLNGQHPWNLKTARRKRTGCLFNCATDNGTSERLPLYAISYPESSGFLVSGATPGRLWGHPKNSIFLIGCSLTVSIVLPQKSCGNKIRCPQSLPGVAPLTTKPEDSGYEIALYVTGTRPRTFSFCCFRNNFFRGTDGYKFLSSIFYEEGMFGPKFFGIIFFS